MIALIVDDEEHVREAIELSVDWEKYGISERLEADNGIRALELIREHHPAVLFCDMSMPQMDGTELLRQLREVDRDTQVIVVSGYSDFQYTQAAIRAWGVDYLLKPFRTRDLEQAVERAVAAWQEKESRKRQTRETRFRVEQADGLIGEQKLAAFLSGEIAYQEGMRGLLYEGDGADEGTWLALVLPCNRTDIVNGRYDGDTELFMFAIRNIVREIVEPYGASYFCRLDPYQWVLLASAGDLGKRDAPFRECIRKLQEAWSRTLGLTTFIGIAGEKSAFPGLPAAVGDARASLLKSMVLDSGQPPASGSVPPRLSDQQVLLETALKNGNKEYAADIIRSFVQAVRERGRLSLKELQAYTLEANLLLERASRLVSSERKIPDLHLPLWINKLEEWEKLLLQQWWKLIEESGHERNGNSAIESMREYIGQHYQEDISLSSLSERFHFSPQYIAKKFKEVYNTTVVTYLTELRIEKARSLLGRTGMTVQEISDMLGYADENYFGKVFKKQTGLTPLQYRKQEQQRGTMA